MTECLCVYKQKISINRKLYQNTHDPLNVIFVGWLQRVLKADALLEHILPDALPDMTNKLTWEMRESNPRLTATHPSH